MTNSVSVIYARVSPTKHIKTDDDIHTSIQESISMCRKDAEHEQNQITHEYVDQYVSGRSSKEMPAFNQMLRDARAHKFDRIYCRRVNRFGRNRADMIRAEIELSELSISLKFVENGIDTAKPFGKSIMAILADLAEMEREEILKNVTRGRERAKLNGVKFGKPPKKVNVDLVRRERLAGTTWKQLEADLKVSTTVMIRRLKEAGHWDFIRRTVK
jgi:DNA invertase Pin-like site-specific DNA recombinase